MIQKLFLSGLSLILFLVFTEIISRYLPITADTRTKLEQAYIPPFSEKNDSILRIFAYGGSTTQGLPDTRLGFVAQLGYQLQQLISSPQELQMYNFGWSGYNSTMVRHLIKQTLRFQPDLLIVYTGHNEFIYPQLDAYWPLRLMTALKNRSHLVQLFLSWQKSRQPPVDLDQDLSTTRAPYRRQPVFFNLKMWLFRRNLQAIVALARQAHIPLILVTPVSNLSQWPPVSTRVTTLPPNSPNLAADLFAQAQTASLSGNFALAQSLFAQARNQDLIPWRATTDQINFIRSLADNATVWVVDAANLAQTASPHGLIGFDLILDNVHPSPQGNYLIAQAIFDVIVKHRVVKSSWWPATYQPFSLTQYLRDLKFTVEDEYAILFRTARYAMKNPFYHFDISRFYLDQMRRLKPNDWRNQALAAGLYFLEGQPELARQQLQGLSLTPEQIAEIPYLNQFL